MRQIFLDTETTGLSPDGGDRIIEIGCIEMVNRRLTGDNKHFYLNPERPSSEDAIKVHGLTDEFLADKPRFAAVADELLELAGRRRDRDPQRRVRRRFSRRRVEAPGQAALCQPGGPCHRFVADGAQPVSRQVQLAGRLVQAPGSRQHRPHAARRAARRGPAGRGLPAHDAWAGLAGHRSPGKPPRGGRRAADRSDHVHAGRGRRSCGRTGGARCRCWATSTRPAAARRCGAVWHNRALSGAPEANPNGKIRAVSSAVEHCLHTAGVAGSNPAPPTKHQAPQFTDLRGFHFHVVEVDLADTGTHHRDTRRLRTGTVSSISRAPSLSRKLPERLRHRRQAFLAPLHDVPVQHQRETLHVEHGQAAGAAARGSPCAPTGS